MTIERDIYYPFLTSLFLYVVVDSTNEEGICKIIETCLQYVHSSEVIS